ncbi:Dyp-type peroxidase [Flindersiella endophytica]
MTNLNRRRLLGLTGLATAAGAAGAAGGYGLATNADRQPTVSTQDPPVRDNPVDQDVIPFHGVHQAGIATPVQDRLHFTAFDVTTDSRDQLITMLKNWTNAAALMTTGKPAGEPLPRNVAAAPDDGGETLDLSPARLTITIGFGPTLFEKFGRDRFGIAKGKPEALAELPKFPGDHLSPERGGGDIAIQACADDPQVATHAIRQLTRLALGTAMVRWTQLGFGKTASTTPAEQTPRNLMGFKDGTNNINGTDTTALNRHVWVSNSDGPDWLVGGSYIVARRIRIHLEAWDQASIEDQHNTIGRLKGTGAPLGRRAERDALNLAALPTDSHVRLAHPDTNNGTRILRRSYSYIDGSDQQGRLDAGIFFLAYQRDPRTGFIPLQTKLATNDRLNTYIRHTASGIWACPPGPKPGHYWGQELLA